MERFFSKKTDPIRNESRLSVDCLMHVATSVNEMEEDGIKKDNPMALRSLLMENNSLFKSVPELWEVTERFFPQLASHFLKTMETVQTNILDGAEHGYRSGHLHGYDEGFRAMGTDCLTGLPNRGATDHSMREFLAHDVRMIPQDQLRDSIIGYILYADINGLKRANDSLGHANGDDLIASTAKELKTAIRETDLLGRVGGDEFVGYLPSKSNKLKPIINRLVPILGKASIAMGLVPITGEQADQACRESDPTSFFEKLTADADNLMYLAKDRGKKDNDRSVLYYSSIPEHKRAEPRLRHRAIKYVMGPLKQEIEDK